MLSNLISLYLKFLLPFCFNLYNLKFIFEFLLNSWRSSHRKTTGKNLSDNYDYCYSGYHELLLLLLLIIISNNNNNNSNYYYYIIIIKRSPIQFIIIRSVLIVHSWRESLPQYFGNIQYDYYRFENKKSENLFRSPSVNLS